MMDYQAAYVCLREAILRALAVQGPEAKQILNEALDAAPTASDEPEPDRCPTCGHEVREHCIGGPCMESDCRCESPRPKRRRHLSLLRRS